MSVEAMKAIQMVYANTTKHDWPDDIWEAICQAIARAEHLEAEPSRSDKKQEQGEPVEVIRKALEQGAMLAVYHRYANPAAYQEQIDKLALQLSAELPALKQEQGEPVAWFREEDEEKIYYATKAWDDCLPLYTHLQPKREPVAWKHFDEAYQKACFSSRPQDWIDAALLARQVRNTHLQPKRHEWVGLTDEEIDRALTEAEVPEYFGCGNIEKQIVRAIEAKLKEKNT